MQETLAIVAALLAVVGNFSYLRDAIRGVIVPHPYTWFIWSIVSLVTFFGQVQMGAGIGALPTGVAEAFTVLIFLFSLKYVFRGSAGPIRPIDHLFLVAALLGLIPWLLTDDPTLSVITVVTIDVIAFIPTLRKAWQEPRTERPTLFALNVARHILTLFALEAHNVATVLHSIAMIVTNTLMTLFVLRRPKGLDTKSKM